jgi:hypothetical protein
LFAGVIYFVLAVGVLLLKDGFNPIPESVTPVGLLLYYLFSGIVGGLIVGLCRPWLKKRSGSTAVGVLALIPASFGVLRLMGGPMARWGVAEWFAVIGTAALLGGFFGYSFWDLQHYDPNAFLKRAEPAEEPTTSKPKRKAASRKRRP